MLLKKKNIKKKPTKNMKVEFLSGLYLRCKAVSSPALLVLKC